MKSIAVLTGAGISAESGLKTFRDSGGLWEGFDIMKVATPEAWSENPELVLDFYNKRRTDAAKAKPNAAHLALVALEQSYQVTIITQNVDDLHERAGSSQIIHLHGQLNKARSTVDDNLIYHIGDAPICIGDKCEKGSQLRPHIVWFGENVPAIDVASRVASQCDIFIVIGTSLNVYPAAGLLTYTKNQTSVYIIDPHIPTLPKKPNYICIQEAASIGMVKLVSELL